MRLRFPFAGLLLPAFAVASIGCFGSSSTAMPDGSTPDAATDDATLADAASPETSGPAEAGETSSPSPEAGGEASLDAAADAPEVGAADAPADGQGAASTFDAAACVDAGGRCEIVLATGQDEPTGVFVSQGYVYWANQGTIGSVPGSVCRAPINGGATVTLATGSDPNDVVATSTDLYWSDYAGGHILTAPLSGVPDAGAGSVFSAASSPERMAIDANNVYWVEIGGAVVKKPLSGGAAITLATVGNPGDLAVDSSNVYFTDRAGGTAGAGAVYSVPIAGGSAPALLMAGLDAPQPVAIDASGVYFGTRTAVYKIPLAGLPDGGTPTTIASGASSPGAIVVQGATVYWTDEGDGKLESAPSAGGGTVATLASGLALPLGLAADATNLYWVNLAANSTVVQLVE